MQFIWSTETLMVQCHDSLQDIVLDVHVQCLQLGAKGVSRALATSADKLCLVPAGPGRSLQLGTEALSLAVIADAANSTDFALDHPTMHEPCLKLIYQLAATAQTSSSVLQGLRDDFNGLMGLLDVVLLKQQPQVKADVSHVSGSPSTFWHVLSGWLAAHGCLQTGRPGQHEPLESFHVSLVL